MHYTFWLINTVIGVLPCSVKVCLRWSIKSNELVFRCKIDDLYLPVYFDDNHGNEFAFCIAPNPFSKCEPWNKNTTVRQYLNKNETVVIVNGTIDQRVNGNWSCHHGRNLYEADVEINIQTQKDTDKDNGLTCFWISGCMLMTGFVLIVIGYSLFHRFWTPMQSSISSQQGILITRDLDERIGQGTVPCCSIFDKHMACFTVLLLSFLLGSIFIGLFDRRPCKESFVPLVLGCILGMAYVVIYLKRKDDHIPCTENQHNEPADDSDTQLPGDTPNEPREYSKLATDDELVSDTATEQRETSRFATDCSPASSNYQKDDLKKVSLPMLSVHHKSTPDEHHDSTDSLGKQFGEDAESTV